MRRICVIGGGAAGMMAAVSAAETAPDARVVLLEQNEKLGKKLYITGKGRCNLTNTCDTQESFGHIVRNPKFLYSAIYGFDHDAVMAFFEESGVRLKEERGGRVFPVSDHASDITKALEKRMKKASVQVRLHTQVRRILIREDAGSADDPAGMAASAGRRQGAGPVRGTDSVRRISGVETADGKRELFDAVIIATGGISYPQTGSTGDGYRFARECGHRIEACRPSLVPMDTQEDWCRDLQGLSLRNVNVRLFAQDTAKKRGRQQAAAVKGNGDGRSPVPVCIAEEFGEMLFTHFGVSGPVILRLSAVPTLSQIDAGMRLEIDLKPALDEETLDRRILRDLEKYGSREMLNALRGLLPQRLIPVILKESAIAPGCRANTLTKEERQRLVYALKHLTIHVRGLRGFHEAIITRGGVSTKDMDPSTMESKRVSGLYFAGEVIDVDAMTGGYNLQIAWSTGRLAGVSAAHALTKKGEHDG